MFVAQVSGEEGGKQSIVEHKGPYLNCGLSRGANRSYMGSYTDNRPRELDKE
jgi:hypothetical protein